MLPYSTLGLDIQTFITAPTGTQHITLVKNKLQEGGWFVGRVLWFKVFAFGGFCAPYIYH